MPNKPTGEENGTNETTEVVDSTSEMPSMVEQTITEGLDASDLEEVRTTHLK